MDDMMKNQSGKYPGATLKNLALPVLGVALLALYALPAQLKPTNFLQDDSYFYLQVAYKIVDGKGSTFHEITPTNGYHPLWMLFSVLGLYLAGADKILGLHIVLAIQFFLIIGIGYYYHQMAQLLRLQFWLVGFAISAAYFFSTGVYASEAHLNAAMLIISIYYFVLSMSSDRSGNLLKSGLFAGLAILARLDNVFVIGSMLSYLALGHLMTDGWRKVSGRFTAFLLPVVFIVFPYLAYNLSVYDHLVPVSGAIKSTFPTMVGEIDNLGAVGQITTFFGFISLIFSLAPGLTGSQRTILGVVAMGVLLHAGYVVLFTDHYTFWPWYYVAGILNMGILFPVFAGWLVSRFSSRLMRKVLPYLVYGFVITTVTAGIARGWLKAYNPVKIGSIDLPQINEYRWPDEVALWMKANLPPHSAVFVHDWPGAIAYYSDLKILPMDGLMNDYQYNDDILEMGMQEYLCSKGVSYFFAPEAADNGKDRVYPVEAPLYRKPAGELRLLNRNKIIHTNDIVKKPSETPPHAIWKIDQECSP
jgi:hypothetical protein